MELRPRNGGFLRPFPTTWFIIEFLKGHGPQGAPEVEPVTGATMTDTHFEYKNALHRAYARDAVEKEEEKRIRRGLAAFSEGGYNERLQHYLARIPYKLFNMRYASFTRYFAHLKRLGWVERIGETEPSAIQEYYPNAPPRVYYRLTRKGWQANPEEIADPIMTLYRYTREQRSAKRHAYFRA